MHLLCPHCHSPIELGELTLSQEVTCPACGSGIRLAGGSTQGAPPRSLGRFELHGSLGSGAFGVVYKARDPAMDRVVAVKVPRAGDLSRPEELERFLREARAAAQLRHPGIVTIHEVGQADGLPFLVCEFVEGVTLADWLSSRRLAAPEAARLAAQAAEALHYAHERGVVHRDVKPSNLMIAGDPGGGPSVKVMDFGLAKREAGEVTLTVEGHVLGTPAYMPPEQARGLGHQVDGRSDVYSLGVVLYQMLTGELPFRGTQRMLLHQVLHDEPRPPRSLNDRVPRDLETVCLKAMAKEPARRYATAKELADDLGRFLRGEPVRARPVGRVEKAWRWCRRNPAVSALSALVILILLGGTVVSTYYAVVADRRALEAGEERDRADREAAEARAQERLARRNLFAAHCNLADAAWHGGNTGRVVRLLDALRPEPGKEDFRGFEWHYLDRLCHDELRELTGHGANVVGLAFSPDGRALASTSEDGAMKLWDAVQGREVRTLPAGRGMARAIAYRLDGRRLAAAAGERGPGRQGEVRFWDPVSGGEVGACRGSFAPAFCLAYSPDGKRLLAGGGDGVVRLWDAETGRELRTWTGHEGPVWGVAFAPDGRRFATTGVDSKVRVWDAEGDTPPRVLEGHTNTGKGVAFSPDGRELASASYDKTVRVWDVESGRSLRVIRGHTDVVNAVAFTPDGRWLVSCGYDRTVRLWDARTGQPRRTLRGHVWGVQHLAVAPDGRRLATCSYDEHTIKVWDVTTDRDLQVFRGHTRGVSAVAFDPARPQLASAGGRVIRVWDRRTAQPVRRLTGHSGPVSALAYSPDGKLLASTGRDQDARLWDAESGRQLRTLTGSRVAHPRIAFSPDGRRLASGGRAPGVQVWDVDGGQQLQVVPSDGLGVTAIAFSPDGRLLAFGARPIQGGEEQNEVVVWDLAEGKVVHRLRGHDRLVSGLRFLPVGRRLVSSGLDDVLILWDLTDGRWVRTMHAHDNQVFGLAVSPDGRRIASASNDQTLKVWDADSGHDLITLRGHTDAVMDAAFSPDGRLLASASTDGTVRLWDARPRTPETRDEREALGLLDHLFEVPLLKEEVVERVRSDRTVPEEVRRVALDLVGGYREPLPQTLAVAWRAAARPGAPEAELRRAARLLGRACEVDPDNAACWTHLATVRYRAGDAAGAVAAFERAGIDKLHPGWLPLVAMAQHRAGQGDKGKRALERAREAAKVAATRTADLHRLLAEAEVVLAETKP